MILPMKNVSDASGWTVGRGASAGEGLRLRLDPIKYCDLLLYRLPCLSWLFLG